METRTYYEIKFMYKGKTQGSLLAKDLKDLDKRVREGKEYFKKEFDMEVTVEVRKIIEEVISLDYQPGGSYVPASEIGH